ncbi:MAG: hypothetical protein J7L15_02105 [Clostridiales bacterium]|nr:hypothetical protein [Clostridiales bacterium]
MITVELLKVILGQDYSVEFTEMIGDTIAYNDYESCSINIYELANKCKEWAINNDYQLSSYTDFGTQDWFCQVTSIDNTGNVYKNTFCDVSEPETIFKACEWILKEKEKE